MHGPEQARRVVQIKGRAAGASCREVVAALADLSFSLPEGAVDKALEGEAALDAEAAAAQASQRHHSDVADSTASVLAVQAAAPDEGGQGADGERKGGRGDDREAVRRLAGGGQGRGALVSEEERETGKVSAEVYSKYLTAVGGWRVALLLLAIQTLWQGFQVGSDWWLSRWSQQPAAEQRAPGAQQANLVVYALLSLGAAAMVLARTMIVSSRGLRGARALFLWQTEAVVRAPMRFFEATPVGRVLNRATEDQNAVDTQLCFAFGSLLAQAFSFVGQLLTTAAITRFPSPFPSSCVPAGVAGIYAGDASSAPLGLSIRTRARRKRASDALLGAAGRRYMLVPVIPMVVVYVKMTLLYLDSSRELQRIQVCLYRPPALPPYLPPPQYLSPSLPVRSVALAIASCNDPCNW